MQVQPKIAARLLSKVAKRPDGCWQWTGCKTKTGYGQIRVGGSIEYAHRVSYALHKGNPGNLYVCHACDNPWCVNPDHLWLGTQQENQSDMAAKGRASAGTHRPLARLTDACVQGIRSALSSGVRVTAVARQFGITPSIVSGIKAGRLWKSVPASPTNAMRAIEASQAH